MITVSVDEAVAFDMLTILFVKKDFCSDANKRDSIKKQIKKLEKEIIASIGNQKFQSILLSKEYNDLYESNVDVFEGVERARSDEISAKELDTLNQKRTTAKRNFQGFHFGKEMVEVKLG